MIAFFFLLLALVVAWIHIWVKRYRSKEQILSTILSYIFLFCFGAMGLLSFYSHIFQADETARLIGWPEGSPFQFEMGVTNLAIGVLGVLAFWYRGLFWMALICLATIIYFGCFIGHLIQYSKGDLAPYNIGLLIWVQDLVIPLIALVLYLFWRKESVLT